MAKKKTIIPGGGSLGEIKKLVEGSGVEEDEKDPPFYRDHYSGFPLRYDQTRRQHRLARSIPDLP
ncbi:MAG: hypothetical protein V3T58_07085 [Candidatus Hydrothermarchaeales archaeon]